MELGRAMKRMKPDVICYVLRALLRPVQAQNLPPISPQKLTPDIISKMANVFEHSFLVAIEGGANETQI